MSVSTSEQTRVERVKLTGRELAELARRKQQQPTSAPRHRNNRPQTPKPLPADAVTYDPLNTPEPPTTPKSEPEFACKAEGFFPHKTNCKKYYWCLEAAGLGMVAHTFTCPTGLFFNTLTDGCDFRRNVDCGDKEDKESPSKASTTEGPTVDEDDESDEDDEEDPRSLKEILSAIKDAGTFIQL